MAFPMPDPRVYVRSQNGIVRNLSHFQRPYVGNGAAVNARELTRDYLSDVASIYSIDGSWLSNPLAEPGDSVSAATLTEMRFAGEKRFIGIDTVTFVQTHFSLPIWEAGVSIFVKENPLWIGSSFSSIHADPVFAPSPPDGAPCMPGNIDEDAFKDILGPNVNSIPELAEGLRNLQINRNPRLLIYQYDPATRIESTENNGIPAGIDALYGTPPTLPIPAVPISIEPKLHYVVSEVLFSMSMPQWGNLNWRAFVEVETCAILYLRAFVSMFTGDVFPFDPPTATGDTTITPAAPKSVLAPLVKKVTLPGIQAMPNNPPMNPPPDQELFGEYVYVVDIETPNFGPPTLPPSAIDFSYSPVCDANHPGCLDPQNFSAVNAYYHCDAAFRMVNKIVTDTGGTFDDYFDGTKLYPDFPVDVDHRGTIPSKYGCLGGLCANAETKGNTSNDGVLCFEFALVDGMSDVGMATDKRAVLHEFGHALLLESLHQPNFVFAHSCGDSLAAIICDPESQLHATPHRFTTFPWIEGVSDPDRRQHDRSVQQEWGWGGDEDDTGYQSEQILSTTLFRVYRSVGGDTLLNGPSPVIATRLHAANYVIGLIVLALGSIPPSANAAAIDVSSFADRLTGADISIDGYDGRTGGTLRKVVDWAFRKQGLYRAPGPLTNTEGDSPPVDIYINDGRAGEYQYQYDFWNTTDIWNRRKHDGLSVHQTPIINQTNYIYVRIKNRGDQAANNVTLRVYSADPGAGLVWNSPGPNNGWKELTAGPYAVGVIPPKGDVIKGPIAWTPTHLWHECLFAKVTNDDDPSNVDIYVNPNTGMQVAPPCATLPTPHWQLVPHDNNIAQRNVVPVPSGMFGKDLIRAFHRRTFYVQNPFARTKNVVVEWTLPYFLRERGWNMDLFNERGSSFKLRAYQSEEIVLRLNPGRRFSRSDVLEQRTEQKIEFRVLIDGQIVGGMTYVIDPIMRVPPFWPTLDEVEADVREATAVKGQQTRV